MLNLFVNQLLNKHSNFKNQLPTKLNIHIKSIIWTEPCSFSPRFHSKHHNVGNVCRSIFLKEVV